MIKLVYIGGYGRSGSTLLESLLTTRADVLACGEVASCMHDRVDRGCTCGKSRQDCEVWRPFHKDPGTLRGLSHEALTLALLDQMPDRYRLMVDSSKTAWGALTAPFKLRRKIGPDFYLLHVVRNPRGVCCSTAGGAWKRHAVIKSPALRHLRTALGWWAANLSCEMFGLLHPSQYQRICYENLTRAHEEVLAQLFADLLPGEDAPRRAAENRHQLYGNQRRYRGFEPSELREDVRWETEMPAAQQTLVSVLTWPLRVKYGY